ncbi:MAG TPA: YIP1 family protein [Terriglobales bacterium]|nr:YIP1 family protein [Terriglobales bacterium]
MSTAPVAAPAAPAPDSGQPGLSQSARILNTFFAPSKTFTDIKRSASWWLPFLLIAVVSCALGFVVSKKVGFEQVTQNKLRLAPKQAEALERLSADDRARQMKIAVIGSMVEAYASPVGRLILILMVSLVLMATFNFGAGAEIPFKQALAVVAYAGLPNIIKGGLAITSLLVGADHEGFLLQNPVATNPAYFMDPTKSLPLYSLAASLDIITLWVLVLTGIGFARVSKLKTATTVGVVFGWYFVLVLIGTGIAALFA